MSGHGVPTVRHALESIVQQARAGDVDGVIQTAQQTLQALNGEQLLTTREAAHLLGIRSINTLKALVIRYGIPYRKVGNRMMLPLTEVERLRESPLMRGLRASETLHNALDELGPSDGLSDEELQDLEASRPGHLPWKTRHGHDVTARAPEAAQRPEGRQARVADTDTDATTGG